MVAWRWRDCFAEGSMLASPRMNRRGARLVSLLLIALALGLCIPDRASAEAPAPHGIVSEDARVTPACDTTTDDEPGLPRSKPGLVAVSAGAVALALVDEPPAAAVLSLPPADPRHVALEVLASRAPPLV
jgi:hypothetical protein